MTIHDTFAGAQFTTSIADLAEERGMLLEVGSDFDEYAKIIASERKEQPLGDPFNPEIQDLSDGKAFWITGWTRDGTLVHTQAMRRVVLQTSMADYLEEHYLEFPPAGLDIDFERSRYIPGPGARRIRGVTAYQGEVWLKPGEKSFRQTGIAGALARFGLASCVLRWSPDYIFGFMPEKHAFRGLMERQGYMHSDPGALFWQIAGANQMLRGFLIWMGREDLTHMMGIPPELLVA